MYDELSHLSLLEKETEFSILKEIRDGDYSNIQTLVQHNIGLVKHEVENIYGWCNEETTDDLIQCGIIGLIEAAKKFEPKFKTKYATYATYRVRQELDDYIVKKFPLVRLPKGLHRKIVKYRKLVSKEECLSNEEIAHRISTDKNIVKPGDVDSIKRLSQGYYCLDNETNKYEDTYEYTHLQLSYDESTLEDALYNEQILRIFTDVFQTLDLECQDVLRDSYGLFGAKKLTYKEVASKYEMTLHQVKAYNTKALDIVRSQLEDIIGTDDF